MTSRVVGLAGIIALSLVLCPRPAAAQGTMHPRWEIPGFDFRPDGAWRVKAREVRTLRRALLAQGSFGALNAPLRGVALAPAAAAVTGTITVPALLFGYQDTDSATAMQDTAQYSAVLFGTSLPSGRPYTLRTFYDEMSDGLLTMQGRVMGWVRLPNTEVTYTGQPGTCSGNPFGTENCNGIFSSAAILAMQGGMRQTLDSVDAAVDFGQFDNDGPDGVPNSADDDGYVDMMMFAHATKDGACGDPATNHVDNNHIWSHRFVFVNSSFFGSPYVTDDPSNSASKGGNVEVFDYFATSALGGAASCDPTLIMPIGTAAHEFGHALALPDLYDTQGSTEGIGRWGLMGSGNFSTAISPARMEAWSLQELGWVHVEPLTTPGVYRFGAAPLSDTTFFVTVQGTNTRNEYFFLENRQAVQADTGLIGHACRVWYQSLNPPPGCSGGLLIWHVDGTKITQGGNALNVGTIHGLTLEEADGARDLWCPGSVPDGCNRGDAGDVYPGTTGNTAFVFRTNPAATKNLDGDFAGFAVDQITQVEPDGEMSFRLRFGNLTVVKASDTAAVIQFAGASFNVYRDFLEDGASYAVGVADTQLAANGRTRWRFASWSDGGPRLHTITGSVAGGPITANLDRDFKLIATAGTGGTITADTAVNLAGDFIPEGRAVELTATADAGEFFGGWSGDTTSTDPVLTLPMGRPFTVTATFGTLVISSPAARPAGVMGAAYDDTLRVDGGAGTNSWSITGGALPAGVTLAAATGVLSGFPRATGTFSYEATVVSGTQSESRTFTFSVTAPVLATSDVVTQLLGPGTPLNADQVRYLDFLGNNNSAFDIGDFLAWVKETGAPLSAATMDALMRGRGDRP